MYINTLFPTQDLLPRYFPIKTEFIGSYSSMDLVGLTLIYGAILACIIAFLLFILNIFLKNEKIALTSSIMLTCGLLSLMIGGGLCSLN